MVNFSHFERLELVDDWKNTRGSIDLLIESDYYWAILNGEILKGKNARGPTAIRSKLGWLLSDPMDGTVSNLTVHEKI